MHNHITPELARKGFPLSSFSDFRHFIRIYPNRNSSGQNQTVSALLQKEDVSPVPVPICLLNPAVSLHPYVSDTILSGTYLLIWR